MTKLESLQLLRAFAAIWVMITHVYQRLDIQPFGYLFSGQYGVDVFFILSGFIIYLTTKDNTPWSFFARKRICRIFPLYLTCLVLYYTFFFVSNGVVLSPLEWIQNVLMFPFSDKITFRSLIVAQAWSTCYELYFYFFMALLLLFHVPKRAILWGLGVVFVLFFPLSLIRTPMSEYGFGRYLLSLVGSIHILKFLVGIIIAIYYSRYVSNSCRKKYKVSPIVVMVCFILYFFMLLIPYNHVVAFVGSLILFICVLYSNKYVDKWKECAVKKFCIYLGDISFSIYLIHLLVIRFFIEVCGVQSLFLLMSITIVSTLLLSMFTYRYIEQPFIRFAKK